MFNNDHLNKFGSLSYILLPIGIIFVSYLVEGVVMPKMMSSFSAFYNKEANALGGLCGLCEVMKIN